MSEAEKGKAGAGCLPPRFYRCSYMGLNLGKDYQCNNSSIVRRGGKPYCNQHDPVATRERYEKTRAEALMAKTRHAKELEWERFRERGMRIASSVYCILKIMQDEGKLPPYISELIKKTEKIIDEHDDSQVDR